MSSAFSDIERNANGWKIEKLIKFAKDSKDTNPNLLSDVKNGIVKPSKMLDEAMKRFYDEK